MISKEGLDLIKGFEKFSPIVYICAAGYPTIGFGHVVLPTESFQNSLTEEEGEGILLRDVAKAERSISRLINVSLTSNEFDALVSWTFNLGAGALQRSTLRMKLNRAEYDEVPDEMRKWTRAGGRLLKGLVRRRETEARIFSLGY